MSEAVRIEPRRLPIEFAAYPSAIIPQMTPTITE